MQNSWQTLKAGKMSWNKSTLYSKVVWFKCCGTSFLKPCFLFLCILAGFAFGRRILNEHTSLIAFFLKPTRQLSFLQNLSFSFTARKLFKSLCIFILWVTVWLKFKIIMPAVKRDKNSHWWNSLGDALLNRN